jgi:hypothetical protein
MKLADTQAIAIFMRRPAATIRHWARTGHLTRHGTDPRGRALYDLDQAEQLLKARPPANPWIPLDPDGLPPRTYPLWRKQETERRRKLDNTSDVQQH